MMAANERTSVKFILSQGQIHDAAAGRLLMGTVGKQQYDISLVMGKAYEDGYTRYIPWTLGFQSVVPPEKPNDTLVGTV